jgi:type IV pilus assembly protein PilN
MPRINLLPWRDELRRQKQKEFGALVGVSLLAAVGVVGLVHLQINQMIDHQKRRNAFLDAQIAELDVKIKEIQDLERERDNLVARMRIVEQLQTSRPEVVHLLDEIVTAVPEGVYLTSMVQKERNVTLEGFAQSNARVSSFMRNIERSKWLTGPDLKEIRATSTKEPAATRPSRFTLVFQQAQQRPAAGDGRPEEAAKKGAPRAEKSEQRK